MELRPLGERIVVKRIKAKEMSEGGIAIPEQAREKSTEGEVIAVGPGRLLTDGTYSQPEIDEGDKVIFGQYAGTEVNRGDEEYLIILTDDILAVVR